MAVPGCEEPRVRSRRRSLPPPVAGGDLDRVVGHHHVRAGAPKPFRRPRLVEGVEKMKELMSDAEPAPLWGGFQIDKYGPITAFRGGDQGSLNIGQALFPHLFNIEGQRNLSDGNGAPHLSKLSVNRFGKPPGVCADIVKRDSV